MSVIVCPPQLSLCLPAFGRLDMQTGTVYTHGGVALLFKSVCL